jgi:hypothetical protein
MAHMLAPPPRCAAITRRAYGANFGTCRLMYS